MLVALAGHVYAEVFTGDVVGVVVGTTAGALEPPPPPPHAARLRLKTTPRARNERTRAFNITGPYGFRLRTSHSPDLSFNENRFRNAKCDEKWMMRTSMRPRTVWRRLVASSSEPAQGSAWHPDCPRLVGLADSGTTVASKTLLRSTAFSATRSWTWYNVDGLHGRAGSRDAIELHGNLRTLTCTGCGASESLGSRSIS
jgi:hypothetical protein